MKFLSVFLFLFFCHGCAWLPAGTSESTALTYEDLYFRPAFTVRRWLSPDEIDGMVTQKGDWQHAIYNVRTGKTTITTRLAGQVDAFDWVGQREPKRAVFISTTLLGPGTVGLYDAATGQETVFFANEGFNTRLMVFDDGHVAFNNVVKVLRSTAVYLGHVDNPSSTALLVKSSTADVEFRLVAHSRANGHLYVHERAPDAVPSRIKTYSVGSASLVNDWPLAIGERLIGMAAAARGDVACMLSLQPDSSQRLLCRTGAGKLLSQQTVDNADSVFLSVAPNGKFVSLLRKGDTAQVEVRQVDEGLRIVATHAFAPEMMVERAVVDDSGQNLGFSMASYESQVVAQWLELPSGKPACLGCDINQSVDTLTPTHVEYDVVPSQPIAGNRTIRIHRFAPPGGRSKGTIVHVHGGPMDHVSKRFLLDTFYLTLVRGYTVVVPNIRGSTDQGVAFEKADDGLKRIHAVDDVVDVIKDTVNKTAGPVYLAGGSFAGNYVFAAAERVPDAVKAIVCQKCVSRRETSLSNTPEAIIEFGDARDPAVHAMWDQFEPMAIAHRIKHPVLVLAAEQDERIPVTHMQQFVEKVRAAGGNIKSVVIPRTIHTTSDVVTGEQQVSELANFFDSL